MLTFVLMIFVFLAVSAYFTVEAGAKKTKVIVKEMDRQWDSFWKSWPVRVVIALSIVSWIVMMWYAAWVSKGDFRLL